MDKQQARAIEKSIWRHLDKYGRPQFGWDWPTLRLLYPQIAAVLKQTQRIVLQ